MSNKYKTNKESNDKKAFYKYKKLLRKEKYDLEDWSRKLNKIYSDEEKSETLNGSAKVENQPSPSSIKKSPFIKQIKSFEAKKLEKLKEKEELERREKERTEALERYNVEKRRKRRMMMRRNHKGQPSMASRMELLIEQIQQPPKS